MSTTVCKLSLGPSKRCGAKFSFFRGFYLSESVKKVSEHSGSRILRVRVRPSSFRLTPGEGHSLPLEISFLPYLKLIYCFLILSQT